MSTAPGKNGNRREIDRFWQILLAIGLVFWFGLLWRAVAPAWRDSEQRSLITFFLIAAGLGYLSLWSERPQAGATRPIRAA